MKLELLPQVRFPPLVNSPPPRLNVPLIVMLEPVGKIQGRPPTTEAALAVTVRVRLESTDTWPAFDIANVLTVVLPTRLLIRV